jgi:Cu(I)/Ag(I) efflux system periplasmic protein CusF
MEKIMKTVFAIATVLLIGLSTAQAQSVRGQVKKIDAGAGKMTIDHAPIKSLNMDSMTMVFRVADPEMLKQVKPGDRILFDAERVNGRLQ